MINAFVVEGECCFAQSDDDMDNLVVVKFVDARFTVLRVRV